MGYVEQQCVTDNPRPIINLQQYSTSSIAISLKEKVLKKVLARAMFTKQAKLRKAPRLQKP